MLCHSKWRFIPYQPCISELLWSFPVTSTWMQQLKGAQVFHDDLDHYRSLKCFCYLTDMGGQNGPHIYIQGTHWGKKLAYQIWVQRCASLDDDLIRSFT